jgi:hypothetical protein
MMGIIQMSANSIRDEKAARPSAIGGPPHHASASRRAHRLPAVDQSESDGPRIVRIPTRAGHPAGAAESVTT